MCFLIGAEMCVNIHINLSLRRVFAIYFAFILIVPVLVCLVGLEISENVSATGSRGENEENRENGENTYSSLGTVLYLSSGGKLSRSLGNAGEETFPSSLGILTMSLVGEFTSEKIIRDIEVTSVNYTVYAKGSGIQLNCQFAAYLLVNGNEAMQGTINTDSKPLSDTLSPYKGSAKISGGLKIEKGSSIGLRLYVIERGQGGSVSFGSESAPSSICLDVNSVFVYGMNVTSADGVKVDAKFASIWGREDIVSAEIKVIGPYEKELTITEIQAALKDSSKIKAVGSNLQITENGDMLELSWKWQSGEAKGRYYVVLVIEDKSETVTYAWNYIEVEPGGNLFFSASGGDACLFAPALMLIAVLIGAFALYKKGGLELLDRLFKSQKAVVFLVMLVVVLIVLPGLYVFAKPERTGIEAPGFSIKDTEGKTLTLSSFRGSRIVLDMMSVNCPTCDKETLELKKLRTLMPDVVIISIDVQRSESVAQLSEYKKKVGADWYFAKDTDGIVEKYQVTETPKIVIINAEGKIIHEETGLVSCDKIKSKLESSNSGFLSVMPRTGLTILAFLAGVSAFFSPCAFPLLPGYIGYYLSKSENMQPNLHKRKHLIKKGIAGGFAASLGIIAIYLLVGILVGILGAGASAFIIYAAPAVAVVLIVLGVIMFLDIQLPTYIFSKPVDGIVSKIENAYSKRFGTREDAKGLGALFAYGVGYGTASMGCHAPVFLAVVAAGLISGGFIGGFGAFLMYGLGMGIMMIIFTMAIVFAKSTFVERLTKYLPLIKKGSAVVLVVVGVYLIWYNWSLFT